MPESYIPAEASNITRKQAGEQGPGFAKATQCVSQPKGGKKIIPCPTASLPVIVFVGPVLLRQYKPRFLLHYFFLRTLAIVRASFHLPTLFDPT